MSHWTIYRLRLLNPSFQLLKEACERVAAKLGSRVAYNFEVMHVSGRRERCPLGIPLHHPWANGVGVKVGDDGGVTIVGEGDIAKRVAGILEVEYAALAVEKAATEQGFQVERLDGDGCVTLTLRRGKQVNVVSIKAGSVTVDAQGYEGRECLKDAEALTSSLNGVRLEEVERRLKPEADEGGHLLSSGSSQLAVQSLKGAGFKLEKVASFPHCG